LVAEGKLDTHKLLPHRTQIAEMIYDRARGVRMSRSTLSFLSLPKDDPVRRRPDIAAAIELLAWQPKVTRSFGLQRTIEYFQGQLSGG
jgi:nucleoside-diphosphate-sugar epimerase